MLTATGTPFISVFLGNLIIKNYANCKIASEFTLLSLFLAFFWSIPRIVSNCRALLQRTGQCAALLWAREIWKRLQFFFMQHSQALSKNSCITTFIQTLPLRSVRPAFEWRATICLMSHFQDILMAKLKNIATKWRSQLQYFYAKT